MSNKALSCWLLSRHCDEHMWVFLKCCGLCLLHVWSEAKHVCYEKRAFGRPEGYIEMSSTNCKAAVRSCPEQALMPIDHCYYPFLCEWFWNVAAYVCYMFGQKPHTKQFIAYHYSSLLIITHHYAIHYSSLLIITQIALLIITHHYTTSDGWKNHCVVWRFDATKLCILGHYAWKSRGGLAPPSIFVRNDE